MTGEHDMTSENGPTAEHAATRLERRARLLLRAYPPDYRHDREEEMLGTLVEATTAGQEWPPARDAWSLLRGGIAARAARNRGRGQWVSLRQAAALGLALYVSVEAVSLSTEVPPWGASPLRLLVLSALLAAAVLAVWTGRRAAVAITAASAIALLPYGENYRGQLAHYPVRLLVLDGAAFGPLLLALLALIALTRGSERPPRSWLLLACPPLAALAVRQLLPHDGWRLLSGLVTLQPLAHSIMPDLLTLLAIVALGWLVTDTRPALGVAVSLVVAQLATVIAEIQGILVNPVPLMDLWTWDKTTLEVLALAAIMMVATLWILRRRTRARREAAG